MHVRLTAVLNGGRARAERRESACEGRNSDRGKGGELEISTGDRKQSEDSCLGERHWRPMEARGKRFSFLFFSFFFFIENTFLRCAESAARRVALDISMNLSLSRSFIGWRGQVLSYIGFTPLISYLHHFKIGWKIMIDVSGSQFYSPLSLSLSLFLSL